MGTRGGNNHIDAPGVWKDQGGVVTYLVVVLESEGKKESLTRDSLDQVST